MIFRKDTFQGVMQLCFSLLLFICETCRHEVRLIAMGGIIRALTTAFNWGGSFTFIFGTTFLIYTGSGGELNFQQVFTTLLLVNLVCLNDVIFVVDAFYYLYEASVANTRIQVCHWQSIVLYIFTVCMYYFIRTYFFLKNSFMLSREVMKMVNLASLSEMT